MSRRRGYPDQSCTFATKADAEIRAKSIESEMDCGAFVDRSESESLPLGKLLDSYRMIAYTNQARHASRNLLPARHACGPPGTWTLPILFSHGTGGNMMKRIAAPMVRGMFSAALLALRAISAPYAIWQWRRSALRKQGMDRTGRHQTAGMRSTMN